MSGYERSFDANLAAGTGHTSESMRHFSASSSGVTSALKSTERSPPSPPAHSSEIERTPRTRDHPNDRHGRRGKLLAVLVQIKAIQLVRRQTKRRTGVLCPEMRVLLFQARSEVSVRSLAPNDLERLPVSPNSPRPTLSKFSSVEPSPFPLAAPTVDEGVNVPGGMAGGRVRAEGDGRRERVGRRATMRRVWLEE